MFLVPFSWLLWLSQQAELARAKTEGKRLGRPTKTTEKDRENIRKAIGQGQSISEIARHYRISRALVHNIRDASLAIST